MYACSDKSPSEGRKYDLHVYLIQSCFRQRTTKLQDGDISCITVAVRPVIPKYFGAEVKFFKKLSSHPYHASSMEWGYS
jgi:hypothetical protein